MLQEFVCTMEREVPWILLKIPEFDISNDFTNCLFKLVQIACLIYLQQSQKFRSTGFDVNMGFMDIYIVIYLIFDDVLLINNYLAKHMEHKCFNFVFCPLAFWVENYFGRKKNKL